MICGKNDWDELLEEAYVRAVLEGRIPPPKPRPPMKIEDYGASVSFSLDSLLGDKREQS